MAPLGQANAQIRVQLVAVRFLLVLLASQVGCSPQKHGADAGATNDVAANTLDVRNCTSPEVADVNLTVPNLVEYEVAVAAINDSLDLSGGDAAKTNNVLLIGAVSNLPVYARENIARARPSAVDADLVNAFLELNADGASWRRQFALPVRYELVDSTILAEATKTDGWRSVQKRWPDAVEVVHLSRPAISNDGTCAIIYLEFGHGPLNGGGCALLMRKTEAAWQVEKEFLVMNF